MDTLLVTHADLDRHERRIRKVASSTLNDLRCLVNAATNGLDALALLKFSKVGKDPIKGTELNFIEQLNQTFTAVASMKAARHIFLTLKDAHGITMNLGTNAGHDLEVWDKNKKLIGISEIFASVKPGNNSKLRDDLRRVRESKIESKLSFGAVYFLMPGRGEFKFRDSSKEEIMLRTSVNHELILVDGIVLKKFTL